MANKSNITQEYFTIIEANPQNAQCKVYSKFKFAEQRRTVGRARGPCSQFFFDMLIYVLNLLINFCIIKTLDVLTNVITYR